MPTSEKGSEGLFAAEGFTEHELDVLHGADPEAVPGRRRRYNQVAQLLVFGVGLHREEVPDFFRDTIVQWRDGENKEVMVLDVWGEEDGIVVVEDLARGWDRQIRQTDLDARPSL